MKSILNNLICFLRGHKVEIDDPSKVVDYYPCKRCGKVVFWWDDFRTYKNGLDSIGAKPNNGKD